MKSSEYCVLEYSDRVRWDSGVRYRDSVERSENVCVDVSFVGVRESLVAVRVKSVVITVVASERWLSIRSDDESVYRVKSLKCSHFRTLSSKTDKNLFDDVE